MRSNLDNSVVCVVGLGYVGLPLARAFSKNLEVIGFDTNDSRIKQLNLEKTGNNINYTSDPAKIGQADFIIVCVPTPVAKTKEPDLSYVKLASETISQYFKRDSVVILESTVYPGVTEEIVVPILEISGLKCGKDFRIGYSPERINPGDDEHGVEKVTKVVSGIDSETTELIAQLYGKITKSVFNAKDIKTAEAAKAIENIQRDLNIALMNELSLIFSRMRLSIKDVLDAAATKWNFQRYSPGLVGGYCIPVDPYYLVHKAKELGYDSQVILAGRNINDSMPLYIADITAKAVADTGKAVKGSKVLIMGLTYKENVTDTREAPVTGIIKELKARGVIIYGFDPYLVKIDAEKEFDIYALDSLDVTDRLKFDAIIITVIHDNFKTNKLTDLAKIQNNHPVLTDVRGIYN